ncbi:MAG: porin family protein [Dysgonomonas sp.]
MRKNFKMYILISVLFLGVNVSAQDSRFRFGVKTGVNMSNATIDNKDADPKFKVGHQVGLTVDYALSQTWIIQSGLSFTTKGSKIDDFMANRVIGGDGRNETHTFDQMYLQFPLYAAYRMDITYNFGFVIGAGPYLAYGIGGKTKYKLHEGQFGNGSTELKFDTFGEAKDHFEQLKKLDFGVGFNIDSEFGKTVIGIGYEYGILDISAYEYDNNMKYQNHNVTLTLGYKF